MNYLHLIFEDKMREKLKNVLLRKIIFIAVYFKTYFISASFCLGTKIKKIKREFSLTLKVSNGRLSTELRACFSCSSLLAFKI